MQTIFMNKLAILGISLYALSFVFSIDFIHLLLVRLYLSFHLDIINGILLEFLMYKSRLLLGRITICYWADLFTVGIDCIFIRGYHWRVWAVLLFWREFWPLVLTSGGLFPTTHNHPVECYYVYMISTRLLAVWIAEVVRACQLIWARGSQEGPVLCGQWGTIICALVKYSIQILTFPQVGQLSD